jgi:4-hydroxy-3-polyprenylbenzoate decarboxylase
MAFPTLRDFLDHLEKNDELRRVKVPVDPVLEIAAISDRVMKSPAPHPHAERDKHLGANLGGRALLFESPRQAEFPLAINAFGSYWRICQALGCDSLDALADKVSQLIKPEVPTSLMEKMKKGLDFLKLATVPPKSVRSGICQQVILEGDRADLRKLPILQCWPLDGNIDSDQVFSRSDADASKPTHTGTGRYITLAGIYTRNPDSTHRNVGMYRVQVHGPRLCAMHWHMHHDGAKHYRAWKAVGESKMPLAVVLGGESVLPYAATAPLPPNVSELLFAGFLNGSGIELVKCKTIDLEVPANAEIVIEGYVDLNQKLYEGPFGDHTGFYSLADFYPAFHVTAITHRRDAIYPATIVGKPPMEDYFIGKATERIFLPLLKMLVPDVIDYNLPMSGAFHNCAVLKIRKEYPQQARRLMHAIWGAGQMSFTKFIVVVDEHVDIHDEQQVLFQVFANVDPLRDVEIVKGPIDILDHASIEYGWGGKIGFDATRKWSGEGQVRTWPRELSFDEMTRSLVEKRWREYGIG